MMFVLLVLSSLFFTPKAYSIESSYLDYYQSLEKFCGYTSQLRTMGRPCELSESSDIILKLAHGNIAAACESYKKTYNCQKYEKEFKEKKIEMLSCHRI